MVGHRAGRNFHPTYRICMRAFLVAVLLVSTFASFGQNGITVVMDTKPVGSVIRISKYLGDMQIPLDSLRYRGEQQIRFEFDSRYTDGVYVIDVSTLESFQFVLIGKENITAHIYESGSGMAFKPDQSTENDAFNIMLNLSDVYSASMDTLNAATSYLSNFSPRHTSITDSLTDVYHRIANAYNNSLDMLTNLFPNSYTAQVLIPLDKIPLRSQRPEWEQKFDNDPAFNHVHYFEFIDFSDERIITNPFLSNKILDYLYNYTERSEQGLKEAIDKILTIPGIAPKVQGFLIDLMVDFFADRDAVEFIDHINRTHLGNCELPLPEETLEKIRANVKFNLGDDFPKLSIENQAGHSVPTTALEGELNVVLFWASWCPHCMRELPKLNELYQSMQGKLGVYAISIDTAKADWIQTIKQEDLDWINVNEFKGWESRSLELVGITSTPTLILLDDNLTWIGRARSFDGLYKLVSEQLDE